MLAGVLDVEVKAMTAATMSAGGVRREPGAGAAMVCKSSGGHDVGGEIVSFSMTERVTEAGVSTVRDVSAIERLFGGVRYSVAQAEVSVLRAMSSVMASSMVPALRTVLQWENSGSSAVRNVSTRENVMVTECQ